MRFQATIIPIRDAAFLKGSQTPVEAAAEAIVDKLAEVKNDAKDTVFPLYQGGGPGPDD